MSRTLEIDALEPVPPHGDGDGVVLFELPAEQVAGFTARLRRLGVRPRDFRWLQAGTENDRVLVRVSQPPRLVLWRVLQEQASDSRAFIEQAPKIWVPIGQRLRNVSQLDIPPDHIALVRAPGTVDFAPEAEAGGELDAWPLAARPMAERAGPVLPTIPVPLRLARHREESLARLWVLREDALHLLTEYCRTTHQQLLARFNVAVSASAGKPCVVLRTNSAKGPLPVFTGAASAYCAHLNFPNLFLPVATRLHPALRRDVVRAMFNVTDERVVWLCPLGNGDFRVEALPEGAFGPLLDAVEYKSSLAARVLSGWKQVQDWTPAPFVERPESGARSASDSPAPAAATPRRRGVLTRLMTGIKLLRAPVAWPEITRTGEAPEPIERAGASPGDRLHLARPETTNSALERCQLLESRFLAELAKADWTPGAWAELAAAYDTANNHADAALCWLNALWGQPAGSPPWAWGWLRSECKAGRPEVKAIDPVPWLATTPGPGTTRALAAWVVWASQQQPRPTALTERAAEVHARLESHEHWLPVRSIWLARTALFRAGSSDVLTLARTRDRLNERLRSGGLSLELDTPSFLRFAGDGVRERFKEARRWLIDKRDLIHQWIARIADDAPIRPVLEVTGPNLRPEGLEANVTQTCAYADLILAWGLARFAEQSAAETMRKQGAAALPAADATHAVLLSAFEYRIAQVRDGQAPQGALPIDLLARVNQLSGLGQYAAGKLRELSRILEPTERIAGFGADLVRRGEAKSVGTLRQLPAERLSEQVATILAALAGRPELADAVGVVFERAAELSDEVAAAAFTKLPAALAAQIDAPRGQVRLVAAALRAAEHWDRPDIARQMSAHALRLVNGRTGLEYAEDLVEPTCRGLRRLGLKVECERALQAFAECALRGQSVSRARASRAADWPRALRVMLQVASGWYGTGQDEQAHAILDEARKDLYGAGLPARERTALALTYAATLAHAPARVALGRLEEMFQRLTGLHVSGSTNQYYSLNPLMLIERTVRAVVSDDFAVGPQVRAWLDADELAVRRRIRDELKEVMAGHGL